MTNALVLAVTHRPDIASAWRSLVKPNDRVGIKISAAGGELFTTHRDIVNAIVDGLVAAYPALAPQLLDGEGGINRFVNVFLNDTDVRHLEGLDTAVGERDSLVLLPAMAGG